MRSQHYPDYADFEREQLRPLAKVGWSIDELESGEREYEFDSDPFEASLWEAEAGHDDYSDDD